MRFVKPYYMFGNFLNKCSPRPCCFAFLNLIVSKMIKNLYQFIISEIFWSQTKIFESICITYSFKRKLMQLFYSCKWLGFISRKVVFNLILACIFILGR